mmetsp:Transcript_13735/g.41495  ORF Transcript_13735/g.41495 Transcript_13735/m.41495 type:complete len:206 (+) Transcript_13735:1162-1779(+)
MCSMRCTEWSRMVKVREPYALLATGRAQPTGIAGVGCGARARVTGWVTSVGLTMGVGCCAVSGARWPVTNPPGAAAEWDVSACACESPRSQLMQWPAPATPMAPLTAASAANQTAMRMSTLSTEPRRARPGPSAWGGAMAYEVAVAVVLSPGSEGKGGGVPRAPLRAPPSQSGAQLGPALAPALLPLISRISCARSSSSPGSLPM